MILNTCGTCGRYADVKKVILTETDTSEKIITLICSTCLAHFKTLETQRKEKSK